jgi:CubicO group peptidase (beta-lactamase class C family)
MLIGIVLVLLGAVVFVRGRDPKAPAIEYSDPVSQMLETIRVKHNLPALAAAVVVDGKIVMTNAVGFRKSGGKERVTVDDKFHLGSVTKSMTATVAAMLVEQGKISLDDDHWRNLSGIKSEIHPDYLASLWNSFCPPQRRSRQCSSRFMAQPGQRKARRRSNDWLLSGILARKPEAKPGTKFIYSNQGYTIAEVLEKATGKTWEDLLRSMLFEPLGMTTAGFGAPAWLAKSISRGSHKKLLSRPRTSSARPKCGQSTGDQSSGCSALLDGRPGEICGVPYGRRTRQKRIAQSGIL